MNREPSSSAKRAWKRDGVGDVGGSEDFMFPVPSEEGNSADIGSVTSLMCNRDVEICTRERGGGVAV